MTVFYGDNFLRLLFIWRGSLYKAVLPDLIVFIILWYSVFFVNGALSDGARSTMTGVIATFRAGADRLPLHFLLGFFVSHTVSRWWEQAELLEKCYPDRIVAKMLSVLDNDDKYVVLRQKLIRWVNLECVLAFRKISIRVKKRFPTDQHLIYSGLMTEAELKIYKDTDGPYGKWFLPGIWSANELKLKRKDIDPYAYHAMVDEFLAFEETLRRLMTYHWVKLPLIYAQVATLSTYAYMLLTVIGEQPKLDPTSALDLEEVTLHFPIFTCAQLIFYIAWLKVGESLSDPFGTDDDDFDMNYILDRHLHMAYDTLLHLHDQLPADHDVEETPTDGREHLTLTPLKHTRASAKIHEEPPVHTDLVHVSFYDAETVSNDRVGVTYVAGKSSDGRPNIPVVKITDADAPV